MKKMASIEVKIPQKAFQKLHGYYGNSLAMRCRQIILETLLREIRKLDEQPTS